MDISPELLKILEESCDKVKGEQVRDEQYEQDVERALTTKRENDRLVTAALRKELREKGKKFTQEKRNKMVELIHWYSRHEREQRNEVIETIGTQIHNKSTKTKSA